MAINVSFDEVFEHVMMNAIIAACDENGVLDGLAVSENGAGASMHVDVSAGNAWIGGTKYTEGAITENLVIAAAHATLDRKDLVTYDPTTSAPIVTTGTAAATPIPPNIPAGDILLGIVDVAAAVTTITNVDITDGVVILEGQHGHDSHINRNRSFLITIPYNDVGGSTWRGIVLDATTDESAHYRFKLPTDFVSLNSIKLLGARSISTTGHVIIDMHAYMGDMLSGEHWATHDNTQTGIDINITDGNTIPTTLNNSLLADVTITDVVTMGVMRDADHASDTYGYDYIILGILIDYVSDE